MFHQFCIIAILLTYSHEVSSQELYVGCYTNLSGSFSLMKTFESVSQCLTQCKNNSYLFSAVEDGLNCYCGNNVTTTVPTSYCNLSCKDNNGICGGNGFYAVYTTIPTYFGCFKDDPYRDLPFEKHPNTRTIESCYQACSSSNYKYMAVQFSYNCFCGQQYGKYGKANESECNMSCRENQSQICGGSYRNNIYWVGHVLALKKDYSEVFHCAGKTGMYGDCESPICFSGWKGTKCNYRDCSANNGNCGAHKCENEECSCNVGFKINSIYDECTDIDECDSNPCDNSTSVCTNTIGSYHCSCRDGYEKESQKVCSDINECNSNPCIEQSQTCLNTFGSYICVCSPGYNYINQSDCSNQCNGTLYRRCPDPNSCEQVFGYICVGDNNGSVAGKIVGGVFGVILGLLIIAGIIFLVYRRSYKKKTKMSEVTYNEKRVQIVNTSQSTKLIVSEINKYYSDEIKNSNEQFNKCPKEFNHSQSAAILPENGFKNRFKKMYPYDYNRVKLHDEPDYINASFIQTYRNSSNVSFVAAQGPKHETCEDFWKMIWDHNVNIIIMLTKCIEDGKEKSHQYWPNENKLIVKNFTIRIIEKEFRLNYQKMTHKVTRDNEERSVIHILYTSWVDKSIPHNVFSLLNLREKMISMIDIDSKNNILVHCSAGVGRTGTFIALDYLLRQAEQEGCVDIYECMKFLRNQRCFMIQSPSQYEMCYRAIIMYHEIGKSTFISTTNLNLLNTKVDNLTAELLIKQFKLIEKEVSKNIVKDVDKFKLKSVEIDAVYAPSSQKHSSYIVGSMPDMFETECLCEIYERCNIFVLLDSQELTFIPEDQIRFNNRFIQLINKEEMDVGIKYSFLTDESAEVTYENTNIQDEHPYMNDSPTSMLFHITKDVVTTFDLIIRLYSILKPNLESKDNLKIIILSRKGYEDAGFLLAALNILQMIDLFKEIDLYETVFELRFIQPEICKNIDLYKNLHPFVKHSINKSILNIGRKTMMEHAYEMPTIDI